MDNNEFSQERLKDWAEALLQQHSGHSLGEHLAQYAKTWERDLFIIEGAYIAYGKPDCITWGWSAVVNKYGYFVVEDDNQLLWAGNKIHGAWEILGRMAQQQEGASDEKSENRRANCA